MENYLGWPIVSAENCFKVIRKLGICSWKKLKETQSLDKFFETASKKQMEAWQKFGAKNFVTKYENPQSLETFDGFQTVFQPAAVVFALVKDMVLVTAEWKHGNELITIVPVSGAAGPEEEGLLSLSEKMKATAMREWREETGTKLKSVIPLTSERGVFSVVRNAQMTYFHFLGELSYPIEKVEAKFDRHENLVTVLFPLPEWLKLLESAELWNQNLDFGIEMCARDITYAALRKLNRLELRL